MNQKVSVTARYLNAACYVVSGVFFAWGGGHSHNTWVLLVGLAMLGYGLYVACSRGSYWVHSLTYLVPLIGICYAIYSVNHG